MTEVNVHDFALASALDIARSENIDIWRSPVDGTSSIEVARVGPVHYVPHALERGQSLQLLRTRLLPVEAVFDAVTVEFVRGILVSSGTFSFDGFEPTASQGDVCILGNVFSRNFTHWHEELLKVVVLEHTGLPCSYVITQLPDFARALLDIIGIAPDRILEVEKPTIFASALFSTPVSYRNLSQFPAVLEMLRNRLSRSAVEHSISLGTDLWFDRGSQARLGRRLVNEDEVFRCLERHGVRRVDVGALPLETQLSIALQARLMSGIHGSHFVHAQMMAPGSHVVECFSPYYLNPTYTEIYRVLRHRYSQITSTNTPVLPYRFGTDIHVDCQQLDLALSASVGVR